jgi:hypothetical protein
VSGYSLLLLKLYFTALSSSSLVATVTAIPWVSEKRDFMLNEPSVLGVTAKVENTKCKLPALISGPSPGIRYTFAGKIICSFELIETFGVVY